MSNNTAENRCVLVLGTFDGVHAGHRQLIIAGETAAKKENVPLYAFVYNPHPLAVLCSGKQPPLITSLDEKIALLKRYGIDDVIVQHFTKEIASTEPEQFITELVNKYHPCHMVCGFNYTFGNKGRGNSTLLQIMGEKLGFGVTVVPAYKIENQVVSSTKIRELIANGNIASANKMLGHNYCVSGNVEHGKEIGRKIGFPTANISIDFSKVIPMFGVYAAWVRIDKQNDRYLSVVNIGKHPTFPEGGITMEAYLLDSGENISSISLYEKKATAELVEYLRGEVCFENPQQLSEQIAKDCCTAIKLLGKE